MMRRLAPRATAAATAAAMAVAAAGAMAGAASAESFAIVSGAPSRVEFQSKAPMETFIGRTNVVSGVIDFDPGDLGDSLQVRIQVDMASFDTGIALRNKHMAQNHLHTDRFPMAVFSGGALTDLSSTRLEPGKPVTGTIAGTLDLHGVTKPLEARFEMSLDGSALHVVATFGVVLADHEIPRPQFLMMKLGERQDVTVDVVAKPQ